MRRRVEFIIGWSYNIEDVTFWWSKRWVCDLWDLRYRRFRKQRGGGKGGSISLSVWGGCFGGYGWNFELFVFFWRKYVILEMGRKRRRGSERNEEDLTIVNVNILVYCDSILKSSQTASTFRYQKSSPRFSFGPRAFLWRFRASMSISNPSQLKSRIARLSAPREFNDSVVMA